MDKEQPRQDERIMAALAHGSVLMFGMGIVAAIVLWVTQKEKSRYVAFQAIQAVAYHIAGLAIFLVGMGCWLALYFVSFIPLMTAPEEPTGAALWLFLVATFLMVVPMAQMGLWILGGGWAAARALQGKEFRYLLIGRYLEGWLDDSLPPGSPIHATPDVSSQ